MAEGSYELVPKPAFIKTIHLKMSIGEAKANLKALTDLATPNDKQLAVIAALQAALAAAPADDLP